MTSMERDLVERAKRGDADAFTQLVRASAPRLNGVANLILRDPDRAKDAVQEAFIAAWNGIPALRDADAWDAWLRRLTVRSCYRLARKDQRRTLIERDAKAANQEMRRPDELSSIADRICQGPAVTMGP